MYLFFDTETTGIPRNYKAPVTDLANWPRVVQLAYLLADAAGKELSSGQWLIRPEGFVIPADATRVHGITTQDALARGVPIAEALAHFAGALQGAQLLIAHNMAYDQNVLGAEFLRAGLNNPLPKAQRFCTMDSTTTLVAIPGKYGHFKWPTLGELHHKLFGKSLEEAHNARADVKTCAMCFFELKKRKLIG
jgi:DNA polymerase III subunit epsilon